MTIIHTFLYDSDFVNNTTVIDPVLKTGGMCVFSQRSLSYFANPQEFPDERSGRGTTLNLPLVKVPRLIVDQAQFPQFLTDIQDLWSSAEKLNIFSIIDQLFFAYNANATTSQIELNLAQWPQYLPSSFVLSPTKTQALAYLTTEQTITIPDYVTFTYVIANGTQYQIRIWANNTIFLAQYPLSKIAVVVPPLPLTQLYTLDLVSGIANVFQTALSSSIVSQQTLASYLQSGDYSGFVAQDVTFVDANANTTVVQFNILYNGATPGVISIREAIVSLLLNSGVGTQVGWQARAPSLFVSQLWYLIPLWDDTTNLTSSVVYQGIVPLSVIQADVIRTLYDVSSGFITSNIDVLTSMYNSITIAAVPDAENSPTRLSLALEHTSYQAIPTTNPAFNYMAVNDQSFAILLAAALAVAAGNPNTNNSLSMYTPTGDNRTYVTFTVGDVSYQVITQATYLALAI